MQKFIFFKVLFCALFLAQVAMAADYTFTGYGTVGYAQSDQSYNYQRFISNSGTFMRDSVLGMQADARFNQEWGATVQAKVAASLDNDNRWAPVIPWAFLSYRPSNDWLIRAGKFRVALSLNSENMDVGTTYTPFRFPNELYYVSSSLDGTGASFVKTWEFAGRELNLEGYSGQSNVLLRHHLRDTASTSWIPLKLKIEGLALGLHQQEDIFRIGFFNAEYTRRDSKPFFVHLTANLLPPSSGMSGTYYSPPDASGTTPKFTTPSFFLGVDIRWAWGLQTTGEYIKRRYAGIDIGPDSESAYLSLSKDYGRFTPYVTYAQIQSKNINIYNAVNGAQVTGTPQTMPKVIFYNAQNRAFADFLGMADQHSWALGTAYDTSKKSKFKAEWMLVHTDAMSSFIDAPVKGESGNQHINVYSLSYSFLF